MFGLKSFNRFYAHSKLDIFDVISPRWTSVHAEDEVISWFTSQGFLARKVGYDDYVGIKTGIGEVLHNGMSRSK